MNHFPLSCLLVSALASPVLHAQTAYFSTSFGSTSEVKAFTCFDVDGMAIDASGLKNLSPSQTWFPGTGVNGADKQVMYSMSQRTGSGSTDNWMISPSVHITDADAWLTWDAQSVHHGLRESYEVLIGTSLDDLTSFHTVYSTDAEDYYWQHHMIPLKDYVGRDIHVAFRHTSRQKYLLAIDNVFLGQLGQKEITGNDLTLHSCGLSDTAPIHGTMTNVGADLELQSLECLLDDGCVISTVPADRHFPSGQTREWAFDIPVRLNQGSTYRVKAVDAEGHRYSVASDSVFCTNYPRTMMLDKVTARWCVNCPARNVDIYGMERYLGPQMVEVVTQYPDNNPNNQDPAQLVYDVYRRGLVVTGVPTFYYNRRKNDSSFTLNDALARPCDAQVTLSSAQLADGAISGDVHFEFAEDTDNSVRRYRLAFALVEKTVESRFPQSNANTHIYDNEFYFLPNSITAPYYYYTNVVRGTESAFNGIYTSVPEQVEGRKDYVYHYSFEVPEKIYDASAANLRVVAFMLNTSTRESINASYLDVTDAATEGLHAVGADAPSLHLLMQDGECRIVGAEGQTVRTSVYSTDGRQALLTTARTFRMDSFPAGVYVVRMQAADGQVAAVKVRR